MAIAHSPIPLILARHGRALGLRADRDRSLVRVRHGVYASAADWAALAPWERYVARVHAVALSWDHPVFCHESAGALGGLPIFGEPADIHVLDLHGRTERKGDVAIHGGIGGRRVELDGGIALTSRADTVLDLCRVQPPAFALATADAFLRLTRQTAARFEFVARGRAQGTPRGLRRLEWIERRATPVSESAGETVSRAVIEWLGYEEPELQVTFRYEGHEDRSDFYWRRLRMLGESDGYGKYDADDPAAAKAHLLREKLREDRLRRHEGAFARWDWSDARRYRPLDRKLQAAGLQPIHPQQPALLATLAVDPRARPPQPANRTPTQRPNPAATRRGPALAGGFATRTAAGGARRGG